MIDQAIKDAKSSLQFVLKEWTRQSDQLDTVESEIRKLDPILSAYSDDIGAVWIDANVPHVSVLLAKRESGLVRHISQACGVTFSKVKDTAFGGLIASAKLPWGEVRVYGYLSPGCKLVKREVTRTVEEWDTECDGEIDDVLAEAFTMEGKPLPEWLAGPHLGVGGTDES